MSVNEPQEPLKAVQAAFIAATAPSEGSIFSLFPSCSHMAMEERDQHSEEIDYSNCKGTHCY